MLYHISCIYDIYHIHTYTSQDASPYCINEHSSVQVGVMCHYNRHNYTD
jgi:hypothetical protein